VNNESDLQDKKDFGPMNSTDAGRHIDFNEEQLERAYASMPFSLEPNSNVNVESDLHEKKELSPRNSTDAGRQIDFNDEQQDSECATISSSLHSNSNAIN
jgi:hypothetical protein